MEADLGMKEVFGNTLPRTLWPIRLKPKDDELLSSWITRLSMAHGLSVSRFLSAVYTKISNPFNLMSVDIDNSIRADLTFLLAQRTGTPVDRVTLTTLAVYEGILYERHGRTGRRQGIIPVARSHVRRRHGLQFCPQCLSEDSEPFFRRRWRLVPFVFCAKHKVQLFDRCTACGNVVDLYANTKSSTDLVSRDAITRCYSCHSDLRETTHAATPCVPSQDEIRFQEKLLNALEQRWVEVRKDSRVYSLSYFIVLRRLMKMLLHRRKGADLRKKISQASGIEMFSISYPNTNSSVEDLDVYHRRNLLNMARWLLTDWPERFIEFCKTNDIRCDTLFGNHTNYPFWYWSVVREHLDGSYYTPSDEEIRSALIYYREIVHGHYDSKPEVLKRVSTFLRTVTPFRRKKFFSLFNIPDLPKTPRRKIFYEKLITKPQQGPRYLSDALWEKIEPLIPHIRREKNTPDDRTILNAVLYVLLGGCTWKKLPAEFGKYLMVYYRFQKWRRAGSFEQIWPLCAGLYDNQDYLLSITSTK